MKEIVLKATLEKKKEETSSVSILLKCSAIGIGFNGAETNCGIAHILGILLMNSCNTDIFLGNYYHLQSVRFELYCSHNCGKHIQSTNAKELR